MEERVCSVMTMRSKKCPNIYVILRYFCRLRPDFQHIPRDLTYTPVWSLSMLIQRDESGLIHCWFDIVCLLGTFEMCDQKRLINMSSAWFYLSTNRSDERGFWQTCVHEFYLRRGWWELCSKWSKKPVFGNMGIAPILWRKTILGCK